MTAHNPSIHIPSMSGACAVTDRAFYEVLGSQPPFFETGGAIAPLNCI